MSDSGGAPPPHPPSSDACTGIPIAPGQSIQAAVSAHPAGTVFCLAAGTFAGQQVVPKARDTFIGAGIGSTILDGQLTTARAFRAPGGDPDSVTIKKMTITRYNPGYCCSAVEVGNSASNSPSDFPIGWLLEDVEVSYGETGTGVFMGNNTILRRVNLHHNDVQNVVAKGNNGLIEYSKCDFGNYRKRNDWGNSGGCSKFVLTGGLVVRYSSARDNFGPGWWHDIDNINFTLYADTVERNDGMGIHIEISYGPGIIRRNVVRSNGFGVSPAGGYGAGISISSSGGYQSGMILIDSNTVERNNNDIIALEQSHRGSGTYGPYIVRNVRIANNTIKSCTAVDGSSGQTGFTADAAGQLEGDNNTADSNTYKTDHSLAWTWPTAARTWAQWQGLGFDVHGSQMTEAC